MPSATCGRSSTRASARRTRRSGSSSTRSACLSKAEYPSVALALTARPLSEKLVNATQLDRPRSHLGRSAAEYEAGFALVEKRAQTLAASIDELVARGIGGGDKERLVASVQARASPCAPDVAAESRAHPAACPQSTVARALRDARGGSYRRATRRCATRCTSWTRRVPFPALSVLLWLLRLTSTTFPSHRPAGAAWHGADDVPLLQGHRARVILRVGPSRPVRSGPAWCRPGGCLSCFGRSVSCRLSCEWLRCPCVDKGRCRERRGRSHPRGEWDLTTTRRRRARRRGPAPLPPRCPRHLCTRQDGATGRAAEEAPRAAHGRRCAALSLSLSLSALASPLRPISPPPTRPCLVPRTAALAAESHLAHPTCSTDTVHPSRVPPLRPLLAPVTALPHRLPPPLPRRQQRRSASSRTTSRCTTQSSVTPLSPASARMTSSPTRCGPALVLTPPRPQPAHLCSPRRKWTSARAPRLTRSSSRTSTRSCAARPSRTRTSSRSRCSTRSR